MKHKFKDLTKVLKDLGETEVALLKFNDGSFVTVGEINFSGGTCSCCIWTADNEEFEIIKVMDLMENMNDTD